MKPWPHFSYVKLRASSPTCSPGDGTLFPDDAAKNLPITERTGSLPAKASGTPSAQWPASCRHRIDQLTGARALIPPGGLILVGGQPAIGRPGVTAVYARVSSADQSRILIGRWRG